MLEFLKEMSAKLRIKHTLGSALRPKSNKQNERQIRTLQETLRVAMNGHRRNDLDVRVSYATAAYNFTPHSVTKFAPYELMFGRLPQMDIDLSMPRKEVLRDTQAEYLLKMTERMRHAFNVVRQQLGTSTQKVQQIKTHATVHDRSTS